MNQEKTLPMAIWKPVGLVVLLLALSEFLHDIFRPDWPAWLMPPLLILGFIAGISLAKRDGVAKPALWMTALVSLAFVLVYDILDFFLDPFVTSDVGVGALTALVIVGLWQVLSVMVAVEET
jgi:hypothetical protein